MGQMSILGDCPFLNAEPEACRAASCVFEWLSDCGLNANPARRNADGANVMVNLVKTNYPQQLKRAHQV